MQKTPFKHIWDTKMTLNELLKNIILLLVCAYIAPFLLEGIKEHYINLLEPRTSIGMVTIKGAISDSSPYIKQFHSLFKNPYIKGIVISVDCYDCTAGTSEAIFYELQELKKEFPKPLITLIENECLSGAYLIASTSDYIIAPEISLVGAIGSYTTPPHIQELCNANDATRIEIYQQTTKHIATARKLSLATVSNWADGKIFTGKQALKLGLINFTGSMHTVVTLLKEKALIDGEIEWINTQNHDTASPFSLSLLASKVQ